MSRDSMYQDLQFKDKNIYSNLDKPAAIQQKSPQDRQTSKDVKELERNLLIWRGTSMAVSLCILVVIIVGVAIFLTQCKKVKNQEFQELLAVVCIKKEKPCRYCPNNWLHYSGNCYFYSMDLMNWTDSRDLCRHMGSTLVVIKNQEEQVYVEQTSHDISWIGLSKNKSGFWIGEDGTVLKAGEGLWRPREPNNLGGDEACVNILSKAHNGSGWNDVDCSMNYHSICKQTAVTFAT